MGGPQRVRSLGGASCASTRLARIIPPAPPSLARCQDHSRGMVCDSANFPPRCSAFRPRPPARPAPCSAGPATPMVRSPPPARAIPSGKPPATPACRPGAARPLRRPPENSKPMLPGAALTFCPALRAAEEGRCRCGGGRGGGHSEPDRRPRGRDRRKFCAPAPPGPCGHKSR